MRMSDQQRFKVMPRAWPRLPDVRRTIHDTAMADRERTAHETWRLTACIEHVRDGVPLTEYGRSRLEPKA